MDSKEMRILVTGGASFTGSHLTDELVRIGANATVVDSFSNGRLEDLSTDIAIVFHLAATHGGRGHQFSPSRCLF